MFTVTVTRTVRGDRERVFDALADFPNWKRYMPREFRPLRGPRRRLKSGDKLLVLLDTGLLRLPTAMEVVRVDAPVELVWRGGGGLIGAEHRFLFEDAEDGGTLVRSEEDWSGVLTRVGPVARRVRRQAEIVGGAQLRGIADALRSG